MGSIDEAKQEGQTEIGTEANAPEPRQEIERHHLIGEGDTCYLCKEAATEFLSFSSKYKNTKMELCLAHFEGLRNAFMDYMKSQKG